MNRRISAWLGRALALLIAVLLGIAATAAVWNAWTAIETGCISAKYGDHCRADEPGLFAFTLAGNIVAALFGASGTLAALVYAVYPRGRGVRKRRR